MADVRNIQQRKGPVATATEAPKATAAALPTGKDEGAQAEPAKSNRPASLQAAGNKGAETVKRQAAEAKLPPLPKLPKGARKAKPPKPCACGCGHQTAGGTFIAGHDGRLKGLATRVVRGVMTLDQVEEFAGKGTRDAVAKLVNPGGVVK